MGCSYPGLVLLPDTGKDPLRAGEADGAGGRWWPGESRPVHDHGGFPVLGGCITNPKCMNRPALRLAGWRSSGPPSSAALHDHGGSCTAGGRKSSVIMKAPVMIAADAWCRGVASHIRNRWPGRCWAPSAGHRVDHPGV